MKYVRSVAFKNEAGISQSKNHIKEPAGPHARVYQSYKGHCQMDLNMHQRQCGQTLFFTPLNEVCSSKVVPGSCNSSLLS